MVGLSVETLNQLVETLVEWEELLQHSLLAKPKPPEPGL